MIAPSPLTVRSLFRDLYEPKKRVAPKTKQKMRHEVARWERLTGDPPLSEIDGDLFDEVRGRGLSQGLAADTIETTIGSVLTVIRFGQKHGKVDSVPDAGERLSRTFRRKHVPTLADLEAAYLKADAAVWPKLGIPTGDFWRAWLVCSYFTGLRLEDMMERLTWDLVTEDSIATTASKTSKLHVFPYPPVLARHLERLKAIDRDQIVPARHHLIFPITKCPHLVRRELGRISEAAGLRIKIGPQALRRLAGTQWQRAKWGAGQTLLGHTLGVSDRYIAPLILQEAVRLLEVPSAFLTEEERVAAPNGEVLRERIESLDPRSRELVMDMVERLGG